jgi:hypothetical protein
LHPEQAAAPEQNAEEHEMLKKEEKPARRRSAFGAQPRPMATTLVLSLKDISSA